MVSPQLFKASIISDCHENVHSFLCQSQYFKIHRLTVKHIRYDYAPVILLCNCCYVMLRYYSNGLVVQVSRHILEIDRANQSPELYK